jgi:hypothetical protein
MHPCLLPGLKAVTRKKGAERLRSKAPLPILLMTIHERLELEQKEYMTKNRKNIIIKRRLTDESDKKPDR